MEDGLRDYKPWVVCNSLEEVLILVVVEDGLRVEGVASNIIISDVLILVVVEDGLRVYLKDEFFSYSRES